MSRELSLMPLSAALATAFWLVASILLSSSFAHAGEAGASPPLVQPPSCSCPEAKNTRPKFAGLSAELDESDEIAALSSLQHALATVADGATYVWRRDNGRLSGIVSPTSSFRNGAGTVCRHVVVLLTTGYETKKTEGTACRMANGQWQLEG